MFLRQVLNEESGMVGEADVPAAEKLLVSTTDGICPTGKD